MRCSHIVPAMVSPPKRSPEFPDRQEKIPCFCRAGKAATDFLTIVSPAGSFFFYPLNRINEGERICLQRMKFRCKKRCIGAADAKNDKCSGGAKNSRDI